MRSVPFLPLVLASLLGGAIPAQAGCEHTKAVEIPARSSLGPSRDCDEGLDLLLSGMQIAGRARNCPLFAIYTPTHHEAVSTADSTYAYVYGSAAEILIRLDCTAHRFLLFKLDSTCDVVSMTSTVELKLMVTKGCVETDLLH
ncbi:MAG: hypothetical protein ABL997_04110 [Planctomycetota bacterium]